MTPLKRNTGDPISILDEDPTMTLEILPELGAALADADGKDAPVDEIELASRLNQSLNVFEQLTPARKKGAFAVVGALYFQPRRSYGEPVWEMYWQPLSTVVDQNGVDHHSPDVRLADQEVLDCWLRLAVDLHHPVLRARYADLAWEVARFQQSLPNSIPAPRLVADAAKYAIDAYLEAVTRRLASDELHSPWTYIDRAIQLAGTVNDMERRNFAKIALFQLRSDWEARGGKYPFWRFDDIVWEHRGELALTAEEAATVTAGLERQLALRSDASDPELFDPHSAQDAADRLRRWRELQGRTEDIRRAAAVAGAAFESAAKEASALTALAWLADQAARYRAIGDKEGAARVERTIRSRAAEAQGEMKRISVPIEIPKKEFDEWVETVSGASLDEGFSKFVAVGLPNKESIVASIRESAEKSPLSAMMSISITGSDGFPKAVIGSIEDEIDGRTIHHAANRIGHYAPFLNVLLTRIREKYSLDIDRFMLWLSACPFFTAGRRPLLREGIAAWFCEDYVKSVHVLVPQVEAALREILAAIRGSVMRPNRDGGGFRAALLGEILSHERFRTHIPENIRLHFRVLYEDPRGINLRNEMSHGLAATELFDRGIANWVIHSVILIGHLRIGSADTA